jgi:DNA-binding ferritin-like protein
MKKVKKIKDEELRKLGKKENDVEVEKLIKEKKKELEKEKWMCKI